jgi:type II secretory pathway component PulC
VEQEITVDKNDYKAIGGQQAGVNSARLVEIYQRGRISDQIKEYRIMDVKHGSIYQMLGLQSKDMIIAADGYIIPTSQAFWNYLGLIAQLGTGNIETLRGQQPMLLKISFVE